MESIVKVEGVSKHYGSVQALDDVSFEVRPGEIFGLIGPDGAGKSTLFRMLATLLCPESGRITVDGLDVVGDYRKLRACVGYMPGRFSLYPDLTVEDIPTDLVTASGSGLDPHISPASAAVQIPQLAENTGLTEEQLEQFVADNTTGKVLGIFGEETVNVLGVNLDIAEALGLIGGVD